jgi:hypothetical protein
MGIPNDGITDASPAINSLFSWGNEVVLPFGQIAVKSPLIITNHCMVRGMGPYASTLLVPPNMKVFDITVPHENYSTIFRDFGIAYPGVQDQTNFIPAFDVKAATGEHNGFFSDNVGIFYPKVGYNFVNASYWHVDHGMIYNPATAGFMIDNTNVVDSGDMNIENTTIMSPGITSGGRRSAIFYYGGGGLRICNCKIKMLPHGMWMQLAPNATMSDLIVTGGIWEAYGYDGAGSPILMQQQVPGSGRFDKVVVRGVQFGGWDYSQGAVQVVGNFVTNVEYSGNMSND